ncbi:MAG: hypothetical protein KA716_14455 [Gloeotrichia echinulata DEX184]|nr:hypothetical protein [Gloeotrichia echinulata DEX184]
MHFWCGRYANGSALLPGIGDWGLGIGDCTSLRDATRSLLPRSGTAPLSYQGLGIGDWGFILQQFSGK